MPAAGQNQDAKQAVTSPGQHEGQEKASKAAAFDEALSSGAEELGAVGDRRGGTDEDLDDGRPGEGAREPQATALHPQNADMVGHAVALIPRITLSPR